MRNYLTLKFCIKPDYSTSIQHLHHNFLDVSMVDSEKWVGGDKTRNQCCLHKNYNTAQFIFCYFIHVSSDTKPFRYFRTCLKSRRNIKQQMYHGFTITFYRGKQFTMTNNYMLKERISFVLRLSFISLANCS